MPGYGGKGGGRGSRGGGRGPGSGTRGGGMGAGGGCVCVKCGYAAPKKPGIPCMQEKCPNCGSVLMRQGGRHYQQAMKPNKQP